MRVTEPAGTVDAAAADRLTKRARVVFIVYAVSLFIATHWPNLRIEGAPIPRPDLLIHLVVFAVWGGLSQACAFFGPRLSLHNTAYTLLLGLLYAAADEALQGIPALNRHASVDDFIANAAGIAIAGGFARALGARRDADR